MNAVEIEEAVSELAAQPFDAQEFPFAFLTAFGNKETTVRRLRSASSNSSDVPGGVLQQKNIHIATCAPGMVGATLKALRESPKTASLKARFVLATDGATLEAEDLTTGETVACDYQDFPNHFGFFLPLAGITTVKQIRENAFDIRATGRLNRLYVELLKSNPDWGTSERRHDMNHFMARLIFCFFAESTDIFLGEGVFTATISQMSARDAFNTHEVIGAIFRAMNTRTNERAAWDCPRWADAFPYVNGGLFSGTLDAPRFTRIARSYLIHIGGLDWKKINPDIFGSMIQAVAEDEERGALGMHYTSVPNILKVLNPLFLDDLRARLEEAGDNARMLLNLRKRMSRIRVFDPACGSGNFLVIAYKDMREIEAEINRRRGEGGRAHRHSAHQFSRHRVARFPCRDRAAGADHRGIPVRRALSRPEGGFARFLAARRAELDHLRQRLAARLAERVPADRNGREASCRRPVWYAAGSFPTISLKAARTGASTRANELGMRVMQERAYEKRGEQYLLIKSPPASGKSRALMFIALDKLQNQGVKKAIIVVPERSIGGSFADEPLSQYGFWADWQVAPRWNLCNAPGVDDARVAKSKVKAVGEFLASPDRVLVCTHATFRFAVDELGVEAFDDCLIAVDEFHHVSAGEDNKLGAQLAALIARDKAHIVAMTGSYFRGDAVPVLSPQDEARFETVTYTYWEQLNGYEHLKSLEIGYFFYTGSYLDAIMKVLDPALKTIVHIPSVNARESTKDKIKEANEIMDALGSGWAKTRRPASTSSNARTAAF